VISGFCIAVQYRICYCFSTIFWVLASEPPQLSSPLAQTSSYVVAIGKVRAAYAQSFALWQQAAVEFACHDHSIIACSCHIYVLLFFAHIPFVVNHTFNATPTERLQQHHSFLQRTAPVARSFCGGFTRHELHILVTAPFCCDRKSPSGICAKLHTVAASSNRVRMPWSLYYCLFVPHTCIVVLRAHPVRGESHIQRNNNGEVVTRIYLEKKSQNQTWNVPYRYLHIKSKVLCIICIKFLTRSRLFWTYWQFTSNLAANQVHAAT